MTTSRRPGLDRQVMSDSSGLPAHGIARPLQPQGQDGSADRAAHPSRPRAHCPAPQASGVQRQRQRQQDDPQRHRQPEVAAAGFQRDRVVMVRVCPAMLPPTISTAPTSALARPKPASTPVSRTDAPIPQQRGHRAQPAGAQALQLFAVFGPQILDHRPGQRHDDGQDQHGLRDDHRRGREQQRQRPSGPDRDSSR
jgi:hypothetical protein